MNLTPIKNKPIYNEIIVNIRENTGKKKSEFNPDDQLYDDCSDEGWKDDGEETKCGWMDRKCLCCYCKHFEPIEK